MANYTPLIDGSSGAMQAFNQSLTIALHTLWITFVILMILSVWELYKGKKKDPKYDVTKQGVAILVSKANIAAILSVAVFFFSAVFTVFHVANDLAGKQSVNVKNNISAKYEIDSNTIDIIDFNDDETIFDIHAKVNGHPTKLSVEFEPSGEPFIFVEEDTTQQTIESITR